MVCSNLKVSKRQLSESHSKFYLINLCFYLMACPTSGKRLRIARTKSDDILAFIHFQKKVKLFRQ